VKQDNPYVHSNTVEGFFSIFKRGMKGIYQHCGHQHLQRYVTEFDFRYNNRIANGCERPATRREIASRRDRQAVDLSNDCWRNARGASVR
jgi:hypothetical protein